MSSVCFWNKGHFLKIQHFLSKVEFSHVNFFLKVASNTWRNYLFISQISIQRRNEGYRSIISKYELM